MAKDEHGGDQGRDGKTPVKPEGWRSAWELSREYVGFCGTIDQKLKGLRTALLGDMLVAGYSESEAAALVNDQLIGRRKSKQGPECLAASPEAVRILGLTRRDEAIRAKPRTWRSGHELKKEYVGGSIAINKRMAVIQRALLGDMVAAGYSESEAAALVDDHLIGCKRPKQGRECLAASPEAVRILGVRRKSDAAPEKPQGCARRGN